MSTELIEPKKPRKARQRYALNPFLEEVVSTLGDKRVAIAMKSNLLEVDNDTGEVKRVPGQITKMISADRESFVKLYTAQLDSFFELTKRSKDVCKYLLFKHQQEPNKHRVVLHWLYAKQDGFEISRTAWFYGINELLDKKFIASAQIANDYFLNPAIFFNGDRTRFVVEIQRRKTDQEKRETLEKHGQLRLE